MRVEIKIKKEGFYDPEVWITLSDDLRDALRRKGVKEVFYREFLREKYQNHGGVYRELGLSEEEYKQYHPEDNDFNADCQGFRTFLAKRENAQKFAEFLARVLGQYYREQLDKAESMTYEVSAEYYL